MLWLRKLLRRLKPDKNSLMLLFLPLERNLLGMLPKLRLDSEDSMTKELLQLRQFKTRLLELLLQIKPEQRKNLKSLKI